MSRPSRTTLVFAAAAGQTDVSGDGAAACPVPDRRNSARGGRLKALFGLLGRRPPPKADKPLRDELLSIERLEERARALAARFTLDPNPRRAARNVLPRFDDNARVLRESYVNLADAVHRGEFVTRSEERRVGKECRSRRTSGHDKRKRETTS